MKSYRKFFISLILFISAFILIDRLNLSIGTFHEKNLKVVILFIYAIYMWIDRVMPDSFISILVILLIGLLKLDTFAKAISYTFGNTLFIFLFSILMISYAFKKSGLAARVGQAIIGRFSGSGRKALFGLMFASYVLSMFLTAIAGVSMALPIASGAIEENGLKKGDSLAKAYMLGITYGGLVGGIATPLGTPVNLLMMQYLSELGKYNLTFFHWVEIGLPLSFILLLTCFFALIILLKIKNQQIKIKKTEASPLSNKEIRSAACFCLIIILFIFSQFIGSYIRWLSIDMNIISVICCLMIVLPPFEVVSWRDALKDMDWESLIFLVGSTALGYLLYNTGTASLIAGAFFRLVGHRGLYTYVFFICIFTIMMHTLLSSNTVTGTVVAPILISFAGQIGMGSWYVAAPAFYCISLAFILPTESPTNIITYNTGFYELKDMIKIGSILTVLCLCIVGSFLIVIGKGTGLYTIG